MKQPPAVAYKAHLETMQSQWEAALAATQFDAVIVAAGASRNYLFDDYGPTFRANPHLALWFPFEQAEHAALLVTPGMQPKLYFFQPEDFWHLPPEAPDWAGRAFDMKTFGNIDALHAACLQDAQAHNKVAYIGEDPSPNFPVADANPTLLINHLHYQRAYKTEFEIDCIRHATEIGVAGHVAARKAFADGASEFQIHTQFLSASQQTAADLPYANIVALNEHAAVLHYQHYDRVAPAEARSFLIDAGARHCGYAADITRTYSAHPGDRFAELVDALDREQQALVKTIRPGIDYLELHVDMHRRLGMLLADLQLVKCDGAHAFESGITQTFLPHGLGHLLGLQTHDVAGQQTSADGGQNAPPEKYAALRLTRRCEASMVFTIEPGCYFIPMLLEALRQGPLGNEVNWPAVEALVPCGGIRIEDNVLVTDDVPRNFTRVAFAAHD